MSVNNSDQKKECEIIEVVGDLNNNAEAEDNSRELKNRSNVNNTSCEVDGNGVAKSSIKIFGQPIGKIKWFNVFWVIICHILAVYGYCHAIIFGIKVWTLVWTVAVGICSGLGMIAGAHRLWSHRSFKARWPLRVILIIFETIACFRSIFSFVRDHWIHHKYSDTELDPSNATRGFFYAHMGYWLVNKEPQVIEAGRKWDPTDLLQDPIVRFQMKYYYLLVILFWGAVPAAVPYFLWHETIWNSILLCVFTRYIIFLHHFFTIISITHMDIGPHPYDKQMRPTDHRLANYLTLGSGHHNYHHTFPYDYSESEKGWLYGFNPGTMFIDACAIVGLTYDLKKATPEIVEQRVTRTGCPELMQEEKEKSKPRLIIEGIIDWLLGTLVIASTLLLGIALRIIYVAATEGLTFDRVVQF